MSNLDKVFSADNIIITASDKKKRKGGGVNEILRLMGELIDFQEKVETCIEAQDISNNKDKLEELDPHLDNMYQSLVDIVSGGVSAVRNKRGVMIGEENNGSDEDDEDFIEEPSDLKSVSKPITMVNAPTIPRF